LPPLARGRVLPLAPSTRLALPVGFLSFAAVRRDGRRQRPCGRNGRSWLGGPRL